MSAAGLLLCWSVTVSAAQESPFFIEKKQFKKQVKTVAVAPIQISLAFEASEALERRLEDEVIRLLEKKRFTVIPVSEYRSIRDAMSEQVGGLFNAADQLLAARVTTVWDHSFREMLFRHDMDAIANISVNMVSAQFANDRAEWHGVKARVKKSGDKFLGNNKYGGNILAASFRLAMVNRRNDLLYLNYGGIEILQERVGSSLKALPTEGMLKNEKTLMKAISLAVKPL